MSTTRMRIPRMQGRPPHLSGSTVMRSMRLDMSGAFVILGSKRSTRANGAQDFGPIYNVGSLRYSST